MPPMEDEEPVEVRPRSLGRAGRLLQAMRRAESLRPGEPRSRRANLRSAPRVPQREDSLPAAGASEVQGEVVPSGTVPSGTPPPVYQEQDPMMELGQLVSSWKTPGNVIILMEKRHYNVNNWILFLGFQVSQSKGGPSVEGRQE